MIRLLNVEQSSFNTQIYNFQLTHLKEPVIFYRLGGEGGRSEVYGCFGLFSILAFSLILGFHPSYFCLDGSCYAPCWCSSKQLQTRLQLGKSEKVEMILCVVFGCGTRTDQDKGIGFYRIPSVVKSQSSFEEELKTERRENWIQSISRGDTI